MGADRSPSCPRCHPWGATGAAELCARHTEPVPTLAEIEARLHAVPGHPWRLERHGWDESTLTLFSGYPEWHGLNLVTLSDFDSHRAQLVAFLENAPRDIAWLLAEVREHRAARGLEAPAPWRRCSNDEAMWERPCGEVEPEYGECPDGCLMVWLDGLWEWWRLGERVAFGAESSVIGAIGAAEAALTAKVQP